ncbi:MAG: class I SAM-dependent methyltransferase [Candidatus Obscuribacterales bacterium]|nr:class I SAM-dependent methyltransferase [Candidatus Obscuribacterales bacterium]
MRLRFDSSGEEDDVTVLSLVSPEIDEYAVSKSEPTGELLKELVETTHSDTSYPMMLTGPLEGRFLKMMVQVIGAKRVLEIGMFTGYSALSMAEGLPDDAELITCDIDPHHISIARSFFERSPHGKKIHIAEGPALDTLKTLKGSFDLVFIDADKLNYQNYYEATLALLRQGGVILIDNVLWSGKVVKPNCENSIAIAALNDRIAKDERVDRVLLPIRDGLFFIRKR